MPWLAGCGYGATARKTMPPRCPCVLAFLYAKTAKPDRAGRMPYLSGEARGFRSVGAPSCAARRREPSKRPMRPACHGCSMPMPPAWRRWGRSGCKGNWRRRACMREELPRPAGCTGLRSERESLCLPIGSAPNSGARGCSPEARQAAWRKAAACRRRGRRTAAVCRALCPAAMLPPVPVPQAYGGMPKIRPCGVPCARR